MARIRSIKPEFWQDEKLGPLDPLTRLVFLGLVSMADDAGRLIDASRMIDGMLFPYTEDACADALVTLTTLGVIRRGTTASGQRVIELVGWEKHQRVDRPSSTVLPPIDDGSRVPREDVASTSRVSRDSLDLAGVRAAPPPRSLIPVVESKHKMRAPARGRAGALSQWEPTEGHREIAAERGLDLDEEEANFRDFALNRKDPYRDLDAGFRRWLREAHKFERGSARNGGAPATPYPDINPDEWEGS